MADEFVNPSSESFESETPGSPGSPGSPAAASAVFETEAIPDSFADLDHELTDDELSDLTYAFQAMDVNNDGTIEPPELHAMMRVLGAEPSIADVEQLFFDCKKEFVLWMGSHQHGAILPDFMVQGSDELGNTKHGGERHAVELDIDRSNKQHPLFSRVKRAGKNPAIAYTVGAPITAANKLLSISYGMAKGPATAVGSKVPTLGLVDRTEEEMVEELAALHELQLEDKHLIFAEYAHMMASQSLIQKYCPGDWHKECEIMRAFRSSYDTADVDGDDSLDFEELEMVVMSLDPHHTLTHENMTYLWSIMTEWTRANVPAKASGEIALTFTQFLHGMADVARHDECKGWLDVNKPNKWELLSLLVDTPVSKLEEQQILAALTPLERTGIAAIKRDLVPIDRERTRAVLDRAGKGELSKLDPKQIERMKECKTRATLVSGLIGFLMTVMPCAVENLLVADAKVDGAKDRYDVCDLYSQIDANQTEPSMMFTLPAAVANFPLLKCSVRPVNATLRYEDPHMDWFGYTGIDTRLDPGDNPADVFFDSFETQSMDSYYDSRVYLPANWGGEANCLPGKTWQQDYAGGNLERCANCECEICQCFHHVHGNLGGELVATQNPIVYFWAILGTVIGINVVFELLLLMYYAVEYCVRVAWALDQRLVPLNADRAFVADSLVRAAFELGNPTSPIMGVDPHSEQSGGLKIFLMVLLYKGKVVLTGLLMKAMFGLATPVGLSTYLKPWIGTCGGTVLWDALIGGCIVLQAQIRGFGVFTSVELFNDVMDHHFKDADEITFEGKIEMARCIGVAIVKNGSMYPTMELLLRHAIQYLKLRGKQCVQTPGVLDNQEELIAQMAPGGQLSDEERLVALSLHLLASILDGDMGHTQMDLWEELCSSAGDLAEFYPDRVLYLTTRFREFQFITAEELHLCFNPDVQVEVPSGAKCSYCCFQFQNFLTC